MKQLHPEQLDVLTREELLALVVELFAKIEQLQRRIEELEAANAGRKELRATSKNSSQPPSRDQKANQSGKKKGKKHGPPFGHLYHTRALVDNPDRVVVATVQECEQCHADLSGVPWEQMTRRQITELPRVQPVVIETQQHRVTCPHCHTANHGRLLVGLEAERCFGPNLEATVVYYKHTQHLSYVRIVEAMHDLHGISLSEGAIGSIMERGGERAQPVAEAIRQAVITGSVIRSDETSARVDGRNWWHWVFISVYGVYHTIVPSRSAAAIETVMGGLCVIGWVCDCFSAQLKAPAQVFQLCLAHQLRDLQRLIDTEADTRWAQALRKLFCEAIHLRHRYTKGPPELTSRGYARRVTQIENQLDALLQQRVMSEAAGKLRSRFITHRDKLLTFLHDLDVPPTNNESERALRPSVVHRKVTNGFRSEWGAKAYAALQTIIATAKYKGEQVFQALVRLMGTPVLPFLASSGA